MEMLRECETLNQKFRRPRLADSEDRHRGNSGSVRVGDMGSSSARHTLPWRRRERRLQAGGTDDVLRRRDTRGRGEPQAVQDVVFKEVDQDQRWKGKG